MEHLKYRVIFLILIITTILSVIIIAFLGGEDDRSAYNAQYININNQWIINGKEVNLPCAVRGSVIMERNLPDVEDDQVLAVQCLYFFQVRIHHLSYSQKPFCTYSGFNLFHIRYC